MKIVCGQPLRMTQFGSEPWIRRGDGSFGFRGQEPVLAGALILRSVFDKGTAGRSLETRNRHTAFNTFEINNRPVDL